MNEGSRRPSWSIASMVLQGVAVLAALVAGAVFGREESLVALLYMVPTYLALSMVGFLAALVALARRERWLTLTLVALTLSGIPSLIMLLLFAQKVLARA
jgi:hypothetical protein